MFTSIVQEELSPHARFSSIEMNGYTFENKKKYMRYNVSTNWEPPQGLRNPCTRRARTRLEREVPQLDRAALLKIRACRGRGEGSSVEVLYG